MRILLLLFLLVGTTAFATHLPDHRFAVSGYVRDGEGNPREGVVVLLEHKSGQKFRKISGRDGYFEALFHLHDENLGDEIVVTSENETKKVVLAFDPEDRIGTRYGEVYFGSEPSGSRWVYFGWVALFMGVVGYFALRKKRVMKGSLQKKRREVKR